MFGGLQLHHSDCNGDGDGDAPKVSVGCSCICTCIACIAVLIVRPAVTFYFGRIDMQVATGDGVAGGVVCGGGRRVPRGGWGLAARCAGARRYADTFRS